MYSREKETGNVDLYYGTSKADNATSVSSLDHFHDGIVVFHAVELDADDSAVDAWTTPPQAEKSQATSEVAKSTENNYIKSTRLDPRKPPLSVQTTSPSLSTVRASSFTSTITSPKVNKTSPTFEMSSDTLGQKKQQTETPQETLKWNQWIEEIPETPPGPSEAPATKAIQEIWRLLPSDLILKTDGDTYPEQPSRQELAVLARKRLRDTRRD